MVGNRTWGQAHNPAMTRVDWLIAAFAFVALAVGVLLSGPVCVPYFGPPPSPGCTPMPQPNAFLGIGVGVVATATFALRIVGRRRAG